MYITKKRKTCELIKSNVRSQALYKHRRCHCQPSRSRNHGDAQQISASPHQLRAEKLGLDFLGVVQMRKGLLGHRDVQELTQRLPALLGVEFQQALLGEPRLDFPHMLAVLGRTVAPALRLPLLVDGLCQEGLLAQEADGEGEDAVWPVCLRVEGVFEGGPPGFGGVAGVEDEFGFCGRYQTFPISSRDVWGRWDYFEGSWYRDILGSARDKGRR